MRIGMLNIRHTDNDVIPRPVRTGSTVNWRPQDAIDLITPPERNEQPRQRLHRQPAHRWQLLTLLSIVMTSCALQWSAAQPIAEFESLTFSQWYVLFNAASASMQLPQLYLSAPRVRTKILVATSVTMVDILGGEAIFRRRISEIVDVAFDRVLIEYIETTALTESGHGSWALSLGISALVAPPPISSLPNDTLVISTVDSERRRILDHLLFGGFVRGSNVTISTLQLFGSPMQVLNAYLDGEDFYQIDMTPWVRVSLVLGTGVNLATTSAVTIETTTSSSDAFQNLRLRFLVTRYIQPLKVDTSSILVRDTVMLQDTDKYGVPAILIPIEIHIDDSLSMRATIDGYLRNTSLVVALQNVVPQWSLLTVEVDQGADLLQGRGLALPSMSQYPGQATILVLIDGIHPTHVQHRAAAILDATSLLISHAMDIRVVRLSIERITLVDDHGPTSVRESAVQHSFGGSAFFFSSGSDDMGGVLPPIDRGFVMQILITPVNGAGVSVAWLDSVIAYNLDRTDTRLAFGVFDSSEIGSVAYNEARAQYLQTISNVDTRLDAFAAIGSSFVRIVLKLTIQPNHTVDPIDAFGLYQIRCALLLVLEHVLVNDRDLMLLDTTIPQPDLKYQVRYLARISDENQREGIQRAVHAWRFQQTLKIYSPFSLLASWVELHADGSTPDSLEIPESTTRNVPESSAVPGILRDQTKTVYTFADPQGWKNPSIFSGISPNCPSPPASARFFGCLVLRWSSRYAPYSVYLHTISVTNKIEIASTNIKLPNSDQTKLPAPWIPGALEQPNDWALQFLSTDVQTATMNLTFAFADVSMDFYPNFTISAVLQLTDSQSSEARMQLVSLRRRQHAVFPIPPTADSQSNMYLAGAINNMSATFSVDVTLTLDPHSLLGLADWTSASASWASDQPSCFACIAPVNICQQLSECAKITQCFQQHVGEQMLLHSELLQQLNGSYDLSGVLHSCLSPSSSQDIWWSSRGRTAFVSSLECLIRSSCPIETSPTLKTRLLLRYDPPQQIIRVLPAHFPLSFSFLLDINGGLGASPDGLSLSRTSSEISEMTSEVLSQLRSLVLDLYGNWTRGLDVQTRVLDDPQSGTLEIWIQYWFLDAGVVGLPFVSVVTAKTSEPAPVVEATTVESLVISAVV